MHYEDCKIYILENNEESINELHDIGWGRENIELTKEQVEALLNGKAIGWCDGEYTHVLTLRKEDLNA